MRELKEKIFKGERSLFGSTDLRIVDSIFEEGESPLKESCCIELSGSMFRWKYPLWYCENIKANDCKWLDTARAGVWYSKNVSVADAVIQAPKNFRRCERLTLENVVFTNAAETLWNCRGVKMKNVSAKGDYFAMNCENTEVSRLVLDGNYSFDGAKNLTVSDSRLLSKDAFWNSENVTVRDSFIAGEYLGWNSRNLVFENCTIESLQGMCYIENLVMRNCGLLNTTLAFEYSSVEAEIASKVKSILNPSSGMIKAEEIGELIIEPDKTDPSKTKIICKNIGRNSDKPEWMR
ncbi:DUF3737 family protein [bacterium]|nr:DUF3737 family protein [bacterium]